MASTYVNNLRLEEIGSGEQSGTWGDTTNTNLELIGQATAWGTRAIANASTDNITIADGAADADRCLGLKLTGGGQACTVTLLPNTSSKTWIMYNATSYDLTFTCGSGANVIIPAGNTKVIATDGLGSGGVVHDLLTAVNLAGTTVVDDLTVSDDLTVGDDLAVTGLATIGETLAVTGVLTTTAATVFNGGFASNADSTMGTNKKLIFRDAAIHISSTADGDLSIAADDEIDITSTLIDVNGNLDVSGTALVTGALGVGAAANFSTLEVTGDKTTANNLQLTLRGATNTNKQMIMGFDTTADKSFITSQIAGSASKPLVITASEATFSGTALVTGVLTTTAATVFNGGFAANDGSTISTADNTTQLTLISTDADALVGPVLDLYRNSASPADNDILGVIKFHGEDSAGNKESYASFTAYATDVTSGTEDTTFYMNTTVAGADTNRITLHPSETVFNEESKDINFRVESDGNANMLFVDGEENRVGVNTGSPAATFTVKGTANSYAGGFQVEGTDETSAFAIAHIDGATFISGNATNDHLKMAADGSLSTPTAGTSNVRFGVNAGNSIASGGNQNVVVGDEAGTAITTGDNNTAFGYAALNQEDAHGNNTAIGWSTLKNLNAGAEGYNTAVGSNAGRNMVAGVNNTLIGASAGDAISNTAGNTAVGFESLSAAAGTANTALGIQTGLVLTGSENVLIGNVAGTSFTDADQNVAVGSGALFADVKGDGSVAVGTSALQSQSFSSVTTTENTAVGHKAGKFISDGQGNTFVGFEAGEGITTAKLTGDGNTVVGSNAGVLLQGVANGNTLIGSGAGDSITTAVGNTCVGFGAGAEITDGDNNIAIGNDSHDSGTTGNNNISIGVSSTPSAVGVENQITLGNTGTASLRCHIQTIAALSDERDKTDIVDLPYGLDFINKTRPVQYKWAIRDEYINSKLGTNPHQGKVRNGFIAQELLALGNAEQHQLAFNDNPDRLEASYGSLVPMLVKAVQELSTALDAALARIATLEG